MGAGCVSQILLGYAEITTPKLSGLLLSHGLCMVLFHLVFILAPRLKESSLPWMSHSHGREENNYGLLTRWLL